LLKVYPKTDKKIVLISCWLHDMAYYRAEYHDIAKIKCILNHRNFSYWRLKALEENGSNIVYEPILAKFKGTIKVFRILPAEYIENSSNEFRRLRRR